MPLLWPSGAVSARNNRQSHCPFGDGFELVWQHPSVCLSMNVPVLDPKTVCVEKSEVYQAEQMDKLGIEVVEVELRDAYAFGGGLHCCTVDVFREGVCEDYFPEQR